MPTASSPLERFISCDWGTTNFRLRVVDADSLRVLEESTDVHGIRRMNQAFLDGGQTDRETYYLRFLKERINALPQVHRKLPVVASGMASSSIGLRKLEYANLPLETNGQGIKCEWLSLDVESRLLLISGVKDSNGIMRGEEVQAIGMGEELHKYGAGTLLLPGTHSKHLRFDGERYTAFSTYMTGELFELLSTQSILAASVAAGKLTEKAKAAFLDGVGEGSTGNVSRALFGVRVRDILAHRSAEENYYFLSGLLIGNEVMDVAGCGGEVYLAATEPTLSLYHLALQAILKNGRVHTFNDAILLRALLSGQQKILLHNAR